MPTYKYIAKNLAGETKFGSLNSKNERFLARELRKKDLILIKAETEDKENKKSSFSLPFFGGVPLTEKLMFTRNLRVMIASGLPLPRALETLSSQTRSKKFSRALLDIRERVIKGEAFSQSLKKYPDIFSELFLNMILVGEEAGTLAEVLLILSNQLEREHELKSKITGAMIYPAVIVCAMIGIGIMMLIVVIPTLAEVFEELKIDLPLTTRLVIMLSTFLAERWYLAILLVVAFCFLFSLFIKIEKGKRILDKVLLNLPIISPIIKKTNSANTVRALSSLIASGVPIVRSLEITAKTLGNVYYREVILTAAERVKKGEKLSAIIRPHKEIYPIVVSQMIEVGEETGKTAEVLDKLAEFFEEEVEAITKNLVSVIEPALMIVIGAAIGFFAISMVQPMYSMLGSIQ